MQGEFIDLTAENIGSEHLCCIIRSRTLHPGVEAKRAWLRDRLPEGHAFRKLNEKATAFIEYAPLETAWTPVTGDNYLYLYCLWVDGACKGQGHGRALMETCLADARDKGRSGVCMLGAKKQKHWLTSQAFAEKHGFRVVDTTEDGYELLACSFDGTLPRFPQRVKRPSIEAQELTIYYDQQCPFIAQSVETVRQTCAALGAPVSLILVDTLQAAKALPCVFNNWAAFYKGQFVSVNLLLDPAQLKRILAK